MSKQSDYRDGQRQQNQHDDNLKNNYAETMMPWQPSSPSSSNPDRQRGIDDAKASRDNNRK